MYFFRRMVSIKAPPTGLPSGFQITVTILKEGFFDQDKVRSDFEDLEVVFFDLDTMMWIPLARGVTENTDDIEIRFGLIEAILNDATSINEYYIYYGNKDPNLVSLRPDFTLIEWPIQIDYDDPAITYTRPTEFWRDGVSDVRLAQASLEFYGTAIRVVSNRNQNQGIIEIQIDNEEWVPVDLFEEINSFDQDIFVDIFLDPSSNTVEIFMRDGLSPEVLHRIRLRVSGNANPSALDDFVNIVRIDYVKSYFVSVELEESFPVIWESVVGGSSI